MSNASLKKIENTGVNQGLKTTKTNKARFFAPVHALIKTWQPKTPAEKKALEEAFPTIDPGRTPHSDRLIIQIRTPLVRTSGGLTVTTQDGDAQLWNETVGRVIAIGPTAYHSQRDGTPWPEGDWCEVGDFVQIPVHRSDKWKVERNGKTAHFVFLRSYETMGHIHGNPLYETNRSLGVK